MATFVPGHAVGPSSGGYSEYERPHWANAAGGWVKRPKRRVLPARPKPPVRRSVADPFAPISDEELRRRAGALVQEQLAPIIASIKAAIEGRSQSGQRAIGDLTNALGGLWAGAAGTTRAAYDQAQTQQSGLNTALADRLGSFGQSLGSEVGNKLAFAGPSGEQVASNVGVTGQGAANAGYAKGSAGTEMLNTQSAAAQAAAAKLPGIAGLTGLEHSRALEAQLNRELADQLGSVQSGAAGNIASIYQHLVDQELQKAIAKQSGLINRDKLAADTQYKRQQLAYKRQKDRYDRAIRLQQLGISQQSVTETARHNGITEAQAEKRLIQQAINERNRNIRARKAREAAAKKKKGNPGGLIPPH